jgi:GT2 family glycosyltransferase
MTTRNRNPCVHNHDIGRPAAPTARSTAGGNGRGCVVTSGGVVVGIVASVTVQPHRIPPHGIAVCGRNLTAASVLGAMFRSVGVQVVTYHNEARQLIRLAEAIAATMTQARAAGVEEISVEFGDCSDPATIETLHDALAAELDGVADHVATVAFGANLGSGGGSNALAARRSDDVIWVLNPDTYPSPMCAVELLSTLADEDVGGVDGRQMPIEHPKAHDPVTGDTSWASGSCFMFRREAFEAVGGFDDHFFPMYCDDVDISWRLRLAGWRIRHAPRAALFHDKRITIDGAVAVSDFEITSGTLARLWMTRRYGRPDIEAETLAWVDAAGTAAHRAAADEFLRRTAEGDVPDTIPDADRIAEFIDGEYAIHRFRYVT